jgi:hypothetical protein
MLHNYPHLAGSIAHCYIVFFHSHPASLSRPVPFLYLPAAFDHLQIEVSIMPLKDCTRNVPGGASRRPFE